MVYFDKRIDMTKSNNPCLHRNKKTCDQSGSVTIDVIILIVVISASAYLLYPYVTSFAKGTIEIGKEVIEIMIEEILNAPMVFGCLGLSVFFAVTVVVVITVCMDTKCGRRGCRGLREAAGFDVKLETDEEGLKKPSCLVKNGLFELGSDRCRELETELKKMAPVNGRAVLVFRARCGCCVGVMEVPGPRKSRKVKK